MVMSSFLAGAEMITFFTVPRRCFEASLASVNLPVDSTTTCGAEAGPIDLGRVLDRENLDAFSADNDGVAFGFHFFVEACRGWNRT